MRRLSLPILRWQNLLYYGDNLDILRRYVKDDSVALIYLDPPFKSNQNYNVLFKEKDGAPAKRLKRAVGAEDELPSVARETDA